MKEIKVVLVDDLKILTHSLKILMESDEEIKVVACLRSIEEAIIYCKSNQPDIVLIDLLMPERDGVEGARLIKSINEDIKVIIMTGSDAEDYFVKGMKCAVIDGYLLKTLMPEGLIYSIKAVYYGIGVVDRALFKKYSLKYFKFDCSNDIYKGLLTNRELQVLQLVLQGNSNNEIALEMNISEGTVRNAVSELLTKFNVKNRVNLVIKVLRDMNGNNLIV